MRIGKANKAGYIALTAVMILGAISLILVASLSLVATNNLRTSQNNKNTLIAKSYADACAEEALNQIRQSAPFTGSGSLSLSNGSCNYTVTSQGGQNRTIDSNGTSLDSTRRIKVIINGINPSIAVSSWQEVASF